ISSRSFLRAVMAPSLGYRREVLGHHDRLESLAFSAWFCQLLRRRRPAIVADRECLRWNGWIFPVGFVLPKRRATAIGIGCESAAACRCSFSIQPRKGMRVVLESVF